MTISEFEDSWLQKLKNNDNFKKKSAILEPLMQTHDQSADTLEWTGNLMSMLESEFGRKTTQDMMVSCSCQYPKELLVEAKKSYQEKQNIDLVLDVLQTQFVSFLKNDLELDAGLVDKIVDLGWGLAGHRKGNSIIATKIPKSNNLKDYFSCQDETQKKALYCHCPRMKGAFTGDYNISSTYCYCGAGFYKGIWEEITQKPATVNLLKSVLKGDDICQVEILLS